MKEVRVWAAYEELDAPQIRRWDFIIGVSLLILGNLIAILSVGLSQLDLIGIFVVIIGAIALHVIPTPRFLLESIDENQEVYFASLICRSSFVFEYGIMPHQILSGPYSGAELRRLRKDIEPIRGKYITQNQEVTEYLESNEQVRFSLRPLSDHAENPLPLEGCDCGLCTRARRVKPLLEKRELERDKKKFGFLSFRSRIMGVSKK